METEAITGVEGGCPCGRWPAPPRRRCGHSLVEEIRALQRPRPRVLLGDVVLGAGRRPSLFDAALTRARADATAGAQIDLSRRRQQSGIVEHGQRAPGRCERRLQGPASPCNLKIVKSGRGVVHGSTNCRRRVAGAEPGSVPTVWSKARILGERRPHAATVGMSAAARVVHAQRRRLAEGGRRHSRIARFMRVVDVEWLR